MDRRQIVANLKKNSVLSTLVILFSALFIMITISVILSPLFSLWNSQIGDQLLRLRYTMINSKDKISPNLIHVVLTDSDIYELGIDSQDRKIVAEVLSILQELDIKGVACDILFPEETYPANDIPLNRVVQSWNAIHFPVILNTSNNPIYRNQNLDKYLWYPQINGNGEFPEAQSGFTVYPELRENARGIGHINCTPDNDGFHRRFPLLIKYKEGYIPGISLSLVCDYLKVEPTNIEVTPGVSICLKNANIFENLIEDIHIPIDNTGKIRLNYIGPWEDSFINFRFSDILASRENPQLKNKLKNVIKGSIVVISDLSTVKKDYGATPFGPVFPLSGIHLTIINSILNYNFLYPFSVFDKILLFTVLIILLFINSRCIKLSSFFFWMGLSVVFLFFFKGFIFLFFNKMPFFIEPMLFYLLAFSGLIVFRLGEAQKENRRIEVEFEKEKAVQKIKKDFFENVDYELRAPLNRLTEDIAKLVIDNRKIFAKNEIKHNNRQNINQLNSNLEEIKEKIENIKGFANYLLSLVKTNPGYKKIEPGIDRSTLKMPGAFESIITCNQRMLALFHEIEALSDKPQPILIRGENGVGKELIADVIRTLNKPKKMITINIAGIDDGVFSNTLFGHVKGAYTGADQNQTGLIDQAEGNILFLDEIGDLSPAAQEKLLRLVENQEYLPVGSKKIMKTSVKIIAATNADLEDKQNKGLFRKDLYYRFTYKIDIPPLRDRLEDLPLLVNHFIKDKQKSSIHPKGIDHLVSLLSTYSFPGNIRELSHIIENSVVNYNKTKDITLFFKEYRKQLTLRSKSDSAIPCSQTDISLSKITYTGSFPPLPEVEAFFIKRAMEITKGNQVRASLLLGITPSRLCRWLQKNKFESTYRA